MQPGAMLADKREEAFMTDEEGVDPIAHPADTVALAAGAQEATARTRQESSAALLLHDAAQDFRAVIPTLEGEALQLAVHLYDALDYWQQSQFGGAIAVHNGTQTDLEGEDADNLHRPLQQPGEYAGEAATDKDTPLQNGGTNAASTRKWKGLVGTTTSQADAALGSLDLCEVGEPTLPPGPVAELPSQATTIPWLPATAVAATGETAVSDTTSLHSAVSCVVKWTRGKNLNHTGVNPLLVQLQRRSYQSRHLGETNHVVLTLGRGCRPTVRDVVSPSFCLIHSRRGN